MTARLRLVLAVVFVFAATGLMWLVVFRSSPMPSPTIGLTAISYAELPGWTNANLQPAVEAFTLSCKAIAAKTPTASMGGIGYAGIVRDWQRLCSALPGRNSNNITYRNFFERWMKPALLYSGTDTDGTFTGYYEPLIHGSRERHGVYQIPVYATPENLVTVSAGDFIPALADHQFTGCAVHHQLFHCPDRADIDHDGLPQAKVLFYADDSIAVFFLHIQGSGRVQFDDGTTARVNYDTQNGQTYTAVGKTLIAMGLPRAGMSMQVIRNWLKSHPRDAQRVMESDKSFVFFRLEPTGNSDEGAKGSEGVPLTAGASLAVDLKFHALGVPMYVVTSRPDANQLLAQHSFDALLVAQDSGGAIKGPVRGDIFWGYGDDAASVAGRMNSSGKLYVLLPRHLAERLSPSRNYSLP